MNSKKWVVSLVSITLAVVILFGTLQYILDPFLHYGGERGPLTFRRDSDLYGNPGIAMNYDYNAVLLGTSLAVNTDINELNEIFQCNTIKVTYSGGNSYNHNRILQVCYDYGHSVDKVFWELDETALAADAYTPTWPLPEYLYDDNQINDVSYLLNLDIFYFYTLFDIKQTLSNQSDSLMVEGPYKYDESIYCRENALSSVPYPKQQCENKGNTFYEHNLNNNLEYNILPMIKEHPETEFHFFMPPYSIFFWYLFKKDGTLDAAIYDARTALGKILEYNNAKVHFFQDHEEIITNLDLYMDYTHYKPEIISWMFDEMNKGNDLLTKDTYNQRLDDFYEYINTFDYDEFYFSQSNI